MDAATDISRMIAQIKFEDLTIDAKEACKKDILDTLATTIAGSTAQGIPEVAELICDLGGKKESSLIAYSAKVPAPMAAFLNSLMGHSLDFDDTHDAAVVHAGVNVIPPALALAERKGKVSGKQFMLSVACGIEVMCRAGLAPKLTAMETGWVYTSVFGIFGSAAASAKMLGLDEERTINALGIAYSQSAGNLQCIHEATLSKRMQPAFAARAGLESALFAQINMTGARNIFEGKDGLYKVYTKGQYDRAPLVENLGKEFVFSDISFKPYPCCRYTHPYIYASSLLKKENEIRTEDIESITVTITELERFLCEPSSIRKKPRYSVDAQFSIPWTTTIAMHKGSVKISDLSPEAISDPVLRELAQKVNVKISSEKKGRSIGKGTVEVKLKNSSKVYKKSVSTPKGHPKNPMDWDDLSKKFEDCASWSRKKLDPAAIKKIVDMIRNLEEVDDVNRIIELIN